MKIVWTQSAQDDLDRIEAHLAPLSPRAAGRIWRRVVSRVEAQAFMPLAAPRAAPGSAVRKLVVTGTPYIVFYRVIGDTLEVLYVRHHAQKR